MSTNTITQPSNSNLAKSKKLLNISTKIWFVVAVIGQWLFVYYIAMFYGKTALQGDFESWDNALMSKLSEASLMANIFFGAHIFLAFIITAGGPLQLIPKLQTRFKIFHRWNGRLYILTAVIISITGLVLLNLREILGGGTAQFGQSINASFIMICAILAWRTAVNQDFQAHRRWAIRTFLMVSGVWFFRVGFGFWIFATGGEMTGSTENFDGPFDLFLIFGETFIPLAIAQLYFFTQEKDSVFGRFAMAGLLLMVSIMMAIGIFMAYQVFWLPELS